MFTQPKKEEEMTAVFLIDVDKTIAFSHLFNIINNAIRLEESADHLSESPISVSLPVTPNSVDSDNSAFDSDNSVSNSPSSRNSNLRIDTGDEASEGDVELSGLSLNISNNDEDNAIPTFESKEEKLSLADDKERQWELVRNEKPLGEEFEWKTTFQQLLKNGQGVGIISSTSLEHIVPRYLEHVVGLSKNEIAQFYFPKETGRV